MRGTLFIALLAFACLCACPRPAHAQEDVMRALLCFKEQVPAKDALHDVATRARLAYGTPLQSVTWRYQNGKFSCETIFGKSMTAKSPLKDISGQFCAVAGEAEYNYLLYLPAGYDASRRYPLLLFLHGIGERGLDPTIIGDYGPFQYVLGGDAPDMLIIAPQLEPGRHWVEDANGNESNTEMARLAVFISQMRAAYAIDDSRLYLTGLSMGGRGAYKLACFLPDTFAALAVCCGRAGVWNQPEIPLYDLSPLADTPVWIFHGLSDGTVDPDHALCALRRLLALNPKGHFRLTLYPVVGHDCYTHAYAQSDLYRWMEGR